MKIKKLTVELNLSFYDFHFLVMMFCYVLIHRNLKRFVSEKSVTKFANVCNRLQTFANVRFAINESYYYHICGFLRFDKIVLPIQYRSGSITKKHFLCIKKFICSLWKTLETNTWTIRAIKISRYNLDFVIVQTSAVWSWILKDEFEYIFLFSFWLLVRLWISFADLFYSTTVPMIPTSAFVGMGESPLSTDLQSIIFLSVSRVYFQQIKVYA